MNIFQKNQNVFLNIHYLEKTNANMNISTKTFSFFKTYKICMMNYEIFMKITNLQYHGKNTYYVDLDIDGCYDRCMDKKREINNCKYDIERSVNAS